MGEQEYIGENGVEIVEVEPVETSPTVEKLEAEEETTTG